MVATPSSPNTISFTREGLTPASLTASCMALAALGARTEDMMKTSEDMITQVTCEGCLQEDYREHERNLAGES